MITLCAVALAGCKKDQDQTETGDVHSSPVSVMEAPEAFAARAALPPLPSPDMKGLSVEVTPHNIAAPDALPDMVPVPGMEMSVRISPRMKATPGWIQNFPALLPPMMNCLMKVDSGAAYVTHVAADDNSALRIDISGLDSEQFHCLIDKSGTPSIGAAPDNGDHSSVLFFPRQAGAPVLENSDCYDKEAVVARPNGLIGWLAFPSASCN